MTKKTIDICGLGNGLVDVLLSLSEEEFKKLGFEKASMRLVETDEQQELLQQFSDRDTALVSGGSVANSVVAFSQLGGKAAFITSLGDDRYGLHYKSEFDHFGVELGTGLKFNHTTGTALVIVTPDAERTMRVNLGAASLLNPNDLNQELIARSKWLFIEGYVFANPNTGPATVKQAINIAKKYSTKIAITFSESWVVQAFGDALREAVAQADLVFANEAEAEAFAGCKGAKAAFEKMTSQIPAVVVTAGPGGAYLCYNEQRAHVKAFPCEPIDLTGAGDMFAASTLYGFSQNMPIDKVGSAACYLAMQVITRVGARLPSSVKEYWHEGYNS